MSYCAKCGASNEDTATFCSSCGILGQSFQLFVVDITSKSDIPILLSTLLF